MNEKSNQCKVCKGEGKYRQTYTAGCGFGSFQSMGKCDYCNGTGEERRAAPSSSASEDNPYAAPTWDHEMAPDELEGEASADELPDAVIAGIMGWRGPGAYTAATLRKIRKVIAADRIARQGEPVGKLAEWDRILRASVPERWKHCTSPVGAVQSYIAELERATQAAAPDAEDAREQQPDDADNLSVMLWLLRRLPRAYENPPHIVQAIQRLAKRTGIDVSDSFAERMGSCRATGTDRAQAGEDA